MTAFRQNLDVLFRFRVTGIAPFVRSWGQCVSGIVQQYAQMVAKGCAELADAIPQRPPMAEALPQSKKRRSSTASATPKLKLVIMSVDEVCIRLNNLQFCCSALNEILGDMSRMWKEFPFADVSVESLNLDSLFVSAFDIIVDSQHQIMEILGQRVAFVEMKESLEDALWLPSVAASRVSSTLTRFDLVLSRICGMLHGDLVNETVFGMLRGFVAALERVLLDSSSREFSPDDVALILEDMKTVEDFFIADGEGLESATVYGQTDTLKRILRELMLQPTAELISAFGRIPPEEDDKRAADSSSSAAADGRRTVWTHRNVLRVLLHRTEKEAAAFVKPIVKKWSE